MTHPFRILYAVLDWGLGHASRSIPIIRALLEEGCEVVIASDGRALALLQKEFPELPCLTLPSYNIRYPSKSMIWNIALQLPRIVYTVYKEHYFLKNILSKQNFQLIISDNRFGFYNKNVTSIFITHQINIKTNYAFLSACVNFFNHRFIKQFSACWIPDVAGDASLAGELSKIPASIKNAKFMGLPSRMKVNERLEKKYDVVAVLSGPEPQRSKLEEIIIKQSRKILHKTLIVRGLTNEVQKTRQEANLTIITYLTSEALEQALNQSEIVVARAGYSSILDLAALGKKAILIPTEGQTEQIYLAEKLHREEKIVAYKEEKFDLEKGLQAVKNTTGLIGYEQKCDITFFVKRELAGYANSINN